MGTNFDDTAANGNSRAMRLIDALSTERDATSFARIIVGLFPVWFDFAADKFAVLAWSKACT